MAILTKPTITKGQPAIFTLNKFELALNSKVANDSYFSSLDNWYRVNLVYKSTEGSQYEVVEFDASQTSPTGRFLISENAKDLFEILRIEILDFDGGILELHRSDITPAGFDIDLTVPYLEPATFTIDFSQPLTDLTYSISGRGGIENDALILRFYTPEDPQNYPGRISIGITGPLFTPLTSTASQRKYIYRVYVDTSVGFEDSDFLTYKYTTPTSYNNFSLLVLNKSDIETNGYHYIQVEDTQYKQTNVNPLLNLTSYFLLRADGTSTTKYIRITKIDVLEYLFINGQYVKTPPK